MITCSVRYVLDPYKVAEFEVYARRWIPLVNRFGGIHQGYFLPHEGANTMAIALFSFSCLAAYETYRQQILTDEDCQGAFAFAETTRCILSYERSFLRPIFGDVEDERLHQSERGGNICKHNLGLRSQATHSNSQEQLT